MILQALYELAEREDLMADPDFEPKPVAWLVRVSEEGKLLGIEGTHYIPDEEREKKKPKQVAKPFSVPRESGRTSGDRAFLLFDKAEYVFGIDPESDPDKRRSEEKLTARARLFRENVADCAGPTQDEAVKAVLAFLEDVAKGAQSVALPEDCKSNDLFAFVYAPDSDQLVTDRDKVRAYWKSLRQQQGDAQASDTTCLVTGKTCLPVDKHPALKRVPGGTSSGVAMVSCNTNAFESYGLKRNDNAPVSREAAEACATALNRLLDPSYPDPRQPDRTLPRRNIRLSADTVVCYWSSSEEPETLTDSLAGLLECKPDNVKELYRSIWRGKMPPDTDRSAFYALTLSGTQGRAIVRDWFESTIADVERNLAAHFADLNIVRNAPPPRKGGHPPQIPMPVLAEALAGPAKRRSKAIPAPLAAQFVKAAFAGTSYPLAVLQRAIGRYRVEAGSDEWTAKQWNDARAAMIKAVLNRRKRFQNTQYEEVKPDMDPTTKSDGYALGNLMAVLERIQQEAIGDVNASIIDRYFSGASACPKAVFVRLLKNARHHARKAKDDPQAGGMVFRLERLMDELADRFDPKQNGFPAHLDLEQQGLFVLGYHQMRKWLWMTKDERTEWEAAHPDAPRAYLWGKAKEQPTETTATAASV
ncbi:MAG: type I-C CRISPR-associated protein Cas8c/Csd1 [Planctomycetes bacterium]|nr:type I-C CRISPR-associated protein Cas8c/Csd1 [Planctomycetota bacterium]